MDDTVWATSSLSWISGASPTQRGENLERRLFNAPPGDGFVANIDDLQLSLTPEVTVLDLALLKTVNEINLPAGTNLTYTLLITPVPGTFTHWAWLMITHAAESISNDQSWAATKLPDTDEDGVSNPFDLDDDGDAMPNDMVVVAGAVPLD